MEKIQMLGKVSIKQVVTDGYKQKAGQQLQEEMEKINGDIAAYEDSMQKAITKLTLQGEPNVELYRRQFAAEKDKLTAYKEQLKQSLDAILTLPDGELVDAGESNFLQEIRVGEPFTAAANCEIVVRDDVVIAIREKA